MRVLIRGHAAGVLTWFKSRKGGKHFPPCPAISGKLEEKDVGIMLANSYYLKLNCPDAERLWEFRTQPEPLLRGTQV